MIKRSTRKGAPFVNVSLLFTNAFERGGIVKYSALPDVKQ